MATVISSEFKIVTDYAASQPTINLATSRAMRVLSIQGSGVNNAVITVSKVSSAGVATTMGTLTMENAGLGASLTSQQAIMESVANCTMLESDTIRIVGSAQNSTQCIITAIADSGQTIVES